MSLNFRGMKGGEKMPTLECVTYDEVERGCFTDCGPVDYCNPDD